MEKANESGIGMVGVNQSTHFGCAGYYTKMASSENMIGLAMSNVNPVMTIPRAFGRVLGNNPLSYAAPRGNGDPLFMDVAMSKVAGARIHDYASSGKDIPDGFITNSNEPPAANAGQPAPTGTTGIDIASELDSVAAKFEEEMDKAEQSQ